MATLQLQDYKIYIGPIGYDLSETISKTGYSKIAVLVDENTRRYCLPVLEKKVAANFKIIEIPSGELNKNLDTCQLIWNKMMQIGMDRHSLLINLGGGVIGDMGGFCASTYFRGIDFVQIPTTLLSQVDASIGGKLGIDFNLIKNSIGIFRNPQAVFVDPAFLKTLPPAEIRSGFAEVFKHALIADAGLWGDLQKTDGLDSLDWNDILPRSLHIKQTIVEEDPFEKGLRKALNFGHTIGHAIETFSLKTENPLLHGEAVAIGIVCESWLSHCNGSLSAKELQEISAFVNKCYAPYIFEKKDFKEIINYMKKDKKNKDGEINFTFVPSIGQVLVNQICSPVIIEESLLYYLTNS